MMERIGQTIKENGEQTAESEKRYGRYLEAIGRPDLKEKLTPQRPFGYFSMEYYEEGVIQGGGGLGMLASDTAVTAECEGIPMVTVTPFYPKERKQTVDGNFDQQINVIDVKPEDRGFQAVGEVQIQTLIDGRPAPTKLDVYSKQRGSTKILTITEPNFGALYDGENNSDRRLYQEVALGVGGHQALKEALGVDPSINQLNEAPTVFSAIVRLDEKFQETGDLSRAFEEVRQDTIYTNHTLVQAVEAQFTMDQFERFVVPNIKSEEVKTWLRKMVKNNGGVMRLSTLAIELSGKRNGVSLIHAEEAEKTYVDSNGKKVYFEGITNGIALERWGDPELLAYYKKMGVLDENGLPTSDFKAAIDNLDPEDIDRIKDAARARLREYLKTRRDQYGWPVEIPQGVKVFDWKRRFAGYKRPGMMFEDPNKLARILEDNNTHLLMAGRAHSNDKPMQAELKRILKIVNDDPTLTARVHFIQDYDEPLARAIAQGSDVAINTPQVRDANGNRISTEACGTSWEKAILGNGIIISTPDGGIADPEVLAEKAGKGDTSLPLPEITGRTYEEEVASLYAQMNVASELLSENGEKYHAYLKKQLKEYLPLCCGSRMEKDYLNFGFPLVAAAK
jgi:starch phosphorylase